MTQQEFTAHSLSLLKSMVHQKYSQNTIEHALYLLCPLPRERMPEAVTRFKELADQGLSEIDFRYETSQVFQEIMGYENSPTEMM